MDSFSSYFLPGFCVNNASAKVSDCAAVELVVAPNFPLRSRLKFHESFDLLCIVKSLVSNFFFLSFLFTADISGLSGRLVQAAKQKGSLDNISVIVVFLRDPELIARRPLPPAPSSSPPPQVGPTMEEQQEEYDKLTAKWGWSEPQGGAVFNETPWQQDPVDGLHQQPQNPFGNGDDDEAAGPLHHPTDEELAAKWGWSEDSEVSSSADASSHGFLQNANWKDPEIEALEQEARLDLDSSIPTIGETSGFTEETGLSAKWGWTEPVGEPDSTTTIGEPLQAVHFVATSVQPFEDDDRIGSTSQEVEGQLQAKWGWEDPAAAVAAEKLADADPEEVRREFEKVAAKWDRDLQQFETNPNEQPKSVSHPCFSFTGHARSTFVGVILVYTTVANLSNFFRTFTLLSPLMFLTMSNNSYSSFKYCVLFRSLRCRKDNHSCLLFVLLIQREIGGNLLNLKSLI